MYYKKVLEVTGKSILASASYNLTRKEFYIAVGTIALGTKLGSRNTNIAINTGFCAGVAILCNDAMRVMSKFVDEVVGEESKDGDI